MPSTNVINKSLVRVNFDENAPTKTGRTHRRMDMPPKISQMRGTSQVLMNFIKGMTEGQYGISEPKKAMPIPLKNEGDVAFNRNPNTIGSGHKLFNDPCSVIEGSRKPITQNGLVKVSIDIFMTEQECDNLARYAEIDGMSPEKVLEDNLNELSRDFYDEKPWNNRDLDDYACSMGYDVDYAEQRERMAGAV